MCHDPDAVPFVEVSEPLPAPVVIVRAQPADVERVLNVLLAEGVLPEAHRLPLAHEYRSRVRAALERAL